MASGTIVAESLRRAGREGKLVREHAFNPRSSNGRTAAFGAVNRGSNPCRGAIPSLSNSQGPFVDSIVAHTRALISPTFCEFVALDPFARHTGELRSSNQTSRAMSDGPAF